MRANTAIRWFLRAALAVSLLYPPYAALQEPYSWLGYFPGFVLDASPVADLTLLHIFGAVEVVLALWILSGWRAYIPAALTAALLFAIVLCNLPQFPVLFRDIPIALAAIALAVIEWKRVQLPPPLGQPERAPHAQ